MARFHLPEIEAAAAIIDPVFLHTPQFECEPLSDVCGATVFLKLETANPIRSFKGRGADLLVQRATQPLVCASAGNFGQAVAYAGRKYRIPVTVFASVNANPLKVERMKALGATVIAQGEDFDAAKMAARTFARERGLRFIEDSRDVETAIGAGTIALELLSGKSAFDSFLVPVGNGALINGIGVASKEGGNRTRIVGVQAEGAPAMVESWRQGGVITYPTINTIADGIGVREPVPEALNDMRDAMDEALLVSEENILAAMKLLFHTAGLLVEPSGAVGVAALLQHPAKFRGQRVAVILCGSNLTTDQINRWLF
jgi:threonine dehydratase